MTEHNIRNGTIRWRISKSVKDITQFCASFRHFRDISISHFYLNNLCQGRGWKCRHAIGHINLNKSYRTHFTPVLTIFDTSAFEMFDLQISGQGNRVLDYLHLRFVGITTSVVRTTLVVMPFHGEYKPLWNHGGHFYTSSHRFRDVNV